MPSCSVIGTSVKRSPVTSRKCLRKQAAPRKTGTPASAKKREGVAFKGRSLFPALACPSRLFFDALNCTLHKQIAVGAKEIAQIAKGYLFCRKKDNPKSSGANYSLVKMEKHKLSFSFSFFFSLSLSLPGTDDGRARETPLGAGPLRAAGGGR